MTTTEIKAGLQMLTAIAESIRDLGQVAEGTLYAALMTKIDLAGFNKAIAILVNAGLVSRAGNNVLRWVGPAKEGAR